MQQYQCLVVEDEPLAAEVMKDYISQVPFLHLAATCTDAIYAMDILRKEPIDVVFLDIHLPKIRGLEFIRSIANPPHIIITTAYQDYAVQGYELNVTDYLLKPVEFARFLTAVNKLKLGRPGETRLPGTPAERPYLFFNVSKKRVKIYLDEILYIESLKEYIRITTRDKSILTKYALADIEETLRQNDFLRIHRSFIVAKDKIDAFSATDIEINGKQIPIGRSYKDYIMAVLG